MVGRGHNLSDVIIVDRFYFVMFCLAPRTKSCTLKPIFHQNAKYLASGTFASPNAKDSTSASPNARIHSHFYPTPILIFVLPPTPIPDASQWNIGGVGSWRWVFALGMYISCVR